MNASRREFLTTVSAGVAAGMTQGGFFSGAHAAEDRKLGVALVGLGSLSTHQIAPALAKTQNCRLAAIVTGSPEKEKVWGDKYGVSPTHIYNYEAFDKIAGDDSVDIVYIVLPNSMHAEYTIRAKEVCIDAMLRVGDDRSGVEAIPAVGPNGAGLELRYHLDFGPTSVIPSSTSSYVLTPSEFLVNIAPARTFLSEHDARELQRMGVAQHVTYRDLIVFGTDGPIDNTLRFPDECSRHKLLDLIGDLALCGARVRGTVIARRSGHNLNGRMAEQLLNLHRAGQQQLSHVA